MKKHVFSCLLLVLVIMVSLVSCTPAPSAVTTVPSIPGAASFTIGTAFTSVKALRSSSVVYSNQKNFYQLKHLYNEAGINDVYGETAEGEWIELSDNQLHYVTQGYWKISVKTTATATDGNGNVKNNVVIYTGSTEAYISELNDIVTVYLLPEETEGTGTLLLDGIKMQDLATDGTRYALQYNLASLSTGAKIYETNQEVTRGEASQTNPNVHLYSATVENIPSGSYTVFIYVLANTSKTATANWEVIGASTRNVAIFADSTTKVFGSVEPSNFKRAEFKLFSSDYELAIAAPAESVKYDQEVTFTATCKDADENSPDASLVIYCWSLDGEPVENVTGNTLTTTFSSPGPKDVSCVAKIKTSGIAYDMASTSVSYFANP